MKRGEGWGEDSSWEPGLVCPVLALTMWPAAESQQLMVSSLYIHLQASAGHFRVISLTQPRHTINNYLRTTGEQARHQDTWLLLVNVQSFWTHIGQVSGHTSFLKVINKNYKLTANFHFLKNRVEVDHLF